MSFRHTRVAEPCCEKQGPSGADENGTEIGEALRNISFPPLPVIGTINSYLLTYLRS
jgi:hypothetical protein